MILKGQFFFLEYLLFILYLNVACSHLIDLRRFILMLLLILYIYILLTFELCNLCQHIYYSIKHIILLIKQ